MSYHEQSEEGYDDDAGPSNFSSLNFEQTLRTDFPEELSGTSFSPGELGDLASFPDSDLRSAKSHTHFSVLDKIESHGDSIGHVDQVYPTNANNEVRISILYSIFVYFLIE